MCNTSFGGSTTAYAAIALAKSPSVGDNDGAGVGDSVGLAVVGEKVVGASDGALEGNLVVGERVGEVGDEVVGELLGEWVDTTIHLP